MEQLSKNYDYAKNDVNAFIVGGMAVAYWIAESRMSKDVDAILSFSCGAVDVPSVFVDGEKITYDMTFSPDFGLLDPDYAERATFVKKIGKMNVFVLSPDDIAIMKLSRMADKDIADILSLVDNGFLQDVNILEEIFKNALDYYVGNPENMIGRFEQFRNIVRYRMSMTKEEKLKAGSPLL